jgi:hypothetical protein
MALTRSRKNDPRPPRAPPPVVPCPVNWKTRTTSALAVGCVAEAREQLPQPQQKVAGAADRAGVRLTYPASRAPMTSIVRHHPGALRRSSPPSTEKGFPPRPLRVTTRPLPLLHVALWGIFRLWHTFRAVGAARCGRTGDERPVPDRSWTT